MKVLSYGSRSNMNKKEVASYFLVNPNVLAGFNYLTDYHIIINFLFNKTLFLKNQHNY